MARFITRRFMFLCMTALANGTRTGESTSPPFHDSLHKKLSRSIAPVIIIRGGGRDSSLSYEHDSMLATDCSHLKKNDGRDDGEKLDDTDLKTIESIVSYVWSLMKQQFETEDMTHASTKMAEIDEGSRNNHHSNGPSSTKNLEQDQPTHRCRHRPFVTLAYAQTLDGMIAATLTDKNLSIKEAKNQTIANQSDEIDPVAEAASSSVATTSNMRLSCPQSMILTHYLRSIHDAILVGGSTFLLDKPRLNVRLDGLPNLMNVDRFGNEGLCSSNSRSHVISSGDDFKQPIPVVLDTHLHNLQQLLWGKILFNSLSSDVSAGQSMVQDLRIENIRTTSPIVCCSHDAAKRFVSFLKLFQHAQKKETPPFYKVTINSIFRKRKLNHYITSIYEVTIQKTQCEQEKEQTNHFSNRNKPTISVSEAKTVTFTLLPTPIEAKTQSIDLTCLMEQLSDEFGIESVMVEGGASVLSSFLNSCTSSSRNNSIDLVEIGEVSKSGEDSRSGEGGATSSLVNCVCVTIAPTILGGKWGLPVFGGFSVLSKDVGAKGNCPEMLRVKNGSFASLGRDCIFVGQV